MMAILKQNMMNSKKPLTCYLPQRMATTFFQSGKTGLVLDSRLQTTPLG